MTTKNQVQLVSGQHSAMFRLKPIPHAVAMACQYFGALYRANQARAKAQKSTTNGK